MARIPIGLEAAQSLQPSNSAALLAGWLAVAKDAVAQPATRSPAHYWTT